MRLDHELKRPDGMVCCRNCVHWPGRHRLCQVGNRQATGSWKRCGRYELADEITRLAREREPGRRSAAEVRREARRARHWRRRQETVAAPFIRLVVDNTRPGHGGDHPDGGPSRAA